MTIFLFLVLTFPGILPKLEVFENEQSACSAKQAAPTRSVIWQMDLKFFKDSLPLTELESVTLRVGSCEPRQEFIFRKVAQ